MSETTDTIIQYFRWVREIYGDETCVEGKLVDPEEKTAVTARPAVRKKPLPGGVQQATDQWNDALRSYYEQIKDCQKCSLGSSRKNFVFGMGNPAADVVFVGEAPGRDEDEKGVPFVGRAGQLLDKMLFAIGLKRQDIFIANVLKCRPPNNRDPLPDEVVQCEPYLQRQLDLIKPRILVALGRVSAQVLLKQHESLSNLRREVRSYSGIPLIVTYHPAALLRNPQWKRNAWEDLKQLRRLLTNKQNGEA